MTIQNRKGNSLIKEGVPNLARAPRILDRFAQDLAASGIAGEERAAKLVYLMLTSRFLDAPVSGIVKGPSAAGKSKVVQQTLKFFPESAYYEWSSMSERSLAYDNEQISHRFIVLYEATNLKDGDAAYLMRSLLSEGQIKYMTVEKKNGSHAIRKIRRDGPTGLISTTTQVNLDQELETRYLSIPINDSPAQTRNVLKATAREANKKRDPVVFSQWKELQNWLQKAKHRVAIPFAERLAEVIDPRAIRLRRDFQKVLTLIKAHAILHQASRGRDADGWILATLDDYAVVRGLVGDLIAEGAEVAVSATLQQTVVAVSKELQAGNKDIVTVTAVAKRLNVDPSTAWRRVNEALAKGYLNNHQTRPRRPARLALGEPLPGRTQLLPPRSDLRRPFRTSTFRSTATGK